MIKYLTYPICVLILCIDKFVLGEGAHITKASKTQCSSLYRHWRERLMSEHFSNCKSLKEVERACSPRIDINQ